MLEADKRSFLATMQKQSLDIRQKELSFYLERYANLSNLASIIAGFAFAGLATTRIPKGTNALLAGSYWVAGSMCMTTASYVVVVAAFAAVSGHRLALQAYATPLHAQGNAAGAAKQAVQILESQRQSIFVVFLASFLLQPVSAVMISIIRVGGQAWPVFIVFTVYLWKLRERWVEISADFDIPRSALVTGNVVFQRRRSLHILDLESLRCQASAACACGNRQQPLEGRPSTTALDETNPDVGPRSSSASASSVPFTSRLRSAFSTKSRRDNFQPLHELGAEAGHEDEDEEEERGPLDVPPAESAATTEIDTSLLKPTSADDADVTDDSTIFAGFLFKRGLRSLSREPGYKRRFFVLQPGRLWYYRSWEDHELHQRPINALRPIMLENYVVRKTSPLSLKLVPKAGLGNHKRVWELRAANAVELEAWAHTLAVEADQEKAEDAVGLDASQKR
ncbi:hypothetical protein AB1Y20_006910 [Prymnesium parvum]|uniref:PH domain-containing protein n=1 Tax=Prymnesium parvum TaxID=97485 RepID=A0AB34IZS1_PRYPA